MKKYILLLSILLCICIFISSYYLIPHLQNTDNNIASDTAISEIEKEAYEAYYKVLQNETSFLHYDESTYMNDYLTMYSPDYTVENTSFIILDMDGDSTKEVILKTPIGCEILHYQDGIVYGFFLSHKEMGHIKIDGTFQWAGGGSYFGYGKLQFIDGVPDIIHIASYHYQENSETLTILINHVSATQDEYDSFVMIQNAKENIAWYEFSDKNFSEQWKKTFDLSQKSEFDWILYL